MVFKIPLSEVTLETITASISTAKNRLMAPATADEDVQIVFPKGNFSLEPPHLKNFTMEFHNWNNEHWGKGWVRFVGQGPESTVLITQGPGGAIRASGTYRMAWEGMGFYLGQLRGTTSQGHLVSIDKKYFEVNLEDNFPTPEEMNDANFSKPLGHGYYIRKFHYATKGDDNGDGDEECWINESVKQLGWRPNTYSHVSGRTWRFEHRHGDWAGYNIGDLVAIKNKFAGAEPYVITYGGDVEFRNVRWFQEARGVIRLGTSNVSFIDCAVEPMPNRFPKPQCLMSTSGGPQIGQPDDPDVLNVHVSGYRAHNTGDDALGLFNVIDVDLNNISIRDSFARGILLDNRSSIGNQTDVNLSRAPELYSGGDTAAPAEGGGGMSTTSASSTAGLLGVVSTLRKFF